MSSMTSHVSPSQLIQKYANLASFPASASEGDIAVDTATDIVYTYDVTTSAWIPQSGISQAAGDTRFVNTAGDTMTGLLTVPSLTVNSLTTGFAKFGVAGVVSSAVIAASDIPTGIDASKIGDGTISNAEFQGLQSAMKWVKYTIPHTALQTAAALNDIELFSLPLKSVIHKVVLRPTIQFAGTTVYTLSVGVSGNLTKFLTVSDVTLPIVSTLNYTFAVLNAGPEDFVSATSIRLSALSGVQNLSLSTAGSVDIYVQISVIE